jgi:Cu(I)/Ag(I) efflux system membrane protein CusA/SilA
MLRAAPAPKKAFMQPIAAPVVGGRLSLLIHIVVVTPVLFAWLNERKFRS